MSWLKALHGEYKDELKVPYLGNAAHSGRWTRDWIKTQFVNQSL
jgi:hypothetical protein